MRRKLVGLLTSAAAVLALAGCGGGDGGDPLSGGGGDNGSSDTIIIGSADFPENTLLAEIYAQALDNKGVKVERKFNIGARELYIPALEDGSIDLLPEYTGNLLSYHKKGDVERSLTPEEVYEQAQKSLPEGFELLEMSTAQDKDAVVVTQETAQKHDLETLGDLKPVAGDMTLGAAAEFETRFTGIPGLKEVYGVEFGDFKKLDTAGPISVKSLKDGKVDAVNLFTTQSAIEQNNFVALEDPKNLFLPQNVTPLINSDKATDEVKQTLNAISGTLDTEKLKTLVAQVEVEKQDAATVAKQFLADEGLTS